MILANYYNFTQVVLATLLLVMYITTLGRVCRGRKFSFVVKLIVLMMFSNIALISGSISNYKESLKEKASTEMTLFMWTAAISFATRDATFNVAHWMFAFEYYSISRYMPFLLMKTRPSSRMIWVSTRSASSGESERFPVPGFFASATLFNSFIQSPSTYI